MYEKETISLYYLLKEEGRKNPDSWKYSPIEQWKVDYFGENLNESNLSNFRRTPLSSGTISFPDAPTQREKPWLSGIPLRQKMSGIIYIIKKLHKLNSYKRIKFTELTDNLIGNPCYYRAAKAYLTELSIRNYYYCEAVNRIKNSESLDMANIFEIGGGFGSLALKLMTSSSLNIKNYYLLDLPENLALSFYYLKNNGCHTEVVLSEKNYERSNGINKVFLLPPWMLQTYDFSADLFINILSFQHMTLGNLNFYFNNIERLKIAYLYLMNRNSKKDETDVEILKYPFPKPYKLISSKEAFFNESSPRKYLECLFKRC
ncbi:MAG: putative sugar O-methyltransferase [Candidatus Omnitrophica bacterium]|nr:putative sugar O-methyltransferase [Candidatus Omnitrophota bacterium]MDD5237449.1 putative sugar O-methyltransferase [Candidatus Omnitrophota bacterium]